MCPIRNFQSCLTFGLCSALFFALSPMGFFLSMMWHSPEALKINTVEQILMFFQWRPHGVFFTRAFKFISGQAQINENLFPFPESSVVRRSSFRLKMTNYQSNERLREIRNWSRHCIIHVNLQKTKVNPQTIRFIDKEKQFYLSILI